MEPTRFSRRAFSLGLAGAAFGPAWQGGARPAGQGDGISHDHDAIHQEVTFKASRARVYALLTDSALFDKSIRLSDAMKGGMPAGAAPTAIGKVAGGALILFGGLITGRQLELVPNQRVVQAWRAGSWKPGEYSIVRFELSDDGAGCKLVFDHTGFPAGEAQHLADGWKLNYWQPMAKALA